MSVDETTTALVARARAQLVHVQRCCPEHGARVSMALLDMTQLLAAYDAAVKRAQTAEAERDAARARVRELERELHDARRDHKWGED